MATIDTGVLGEFPYIQLGNGPHTLLVIPGAQVDNAAPGVVVRQTYWAAFAPLARDQVLLRLNGHK